MSTLNIELYDALREAGASEERARAAATAVLATADLATKTDIAALKTDIAMLKAGLIEQVGAIESRLYRTIITGIIAMTTAIIAMTAVFAAVVKLL